MAKIELEYVVLLIIWAHAHIRSKIAVKSFQGMRAERFASISGVVARPSTKRLSKRR
jgi:hypothetical protein